jgi:iron complex outermembrane receptor protein
MFADTAPRRDASMGRKGTHGKPARFARCYAACVLCLAGTFAYGQQPDLADLSLEELGNVLVTSVSGRAEPLSEAAASIYVITHDDIRRSGASTLPEALRLAPNLLVARLDTSQYAISARGFNSLIANKLLVLIDGRTVYTPLFSGVFWDMQIVMLEDIDRIEVISGPGATLWGANAVNGVINVITKSSAETTGTLAAIGGGDREAEAVVRYGGKLGERGDFRVFAKAAAFDNTERANGTALLDEWDRSLVGFRGDLDLAQGSLSLQGNAFESRSQDRGGAPPLRVGRLDSTGVNVLARWTRRLPDGADLSVQTYFDHSDRDDFVLFSPEADVFDVEVQHSVPFGAHKLLWGGGYRSAQDDVANGFLFGFVPPSRELEWANLFVQTELALAEKLNLTLGLKLEDNDYTGTESLPTVRLAWNVSPTQLLWTGLSRAVRAPSRLDRDVILPPPLGFVIRGGPYFVSEVADVVEVGYRAQAGKNATFSATAFHYDWDKLRSGQLPPAFVENMIAGKVYGVEAWATWQAAERWRLSGGLATLQHDLAVKPGSLDPVGPSALGNDPNYQLLVRAAHNFGSRHELDVALRRVDDLPNPVVPAYTAVDVNYSWLLRRDLTLSLRVQNLFDRAHPESGNAVDRSEIERGAFLKIQWTP